MEPRPREGGTARGALAIGAAKGWFLVAGLALNVVLPAAIGQGGYGAFKRAQAFVNILNGVVVVASIQAVSRAVAAASEATRAAVLRRALVLHAGIGLALGVTLVASVPLLVAWQRAPHLATPLRVMAGVLVAYGIYAPLVGGLNGARAFGSQAVLDATYSTLRVVLTVGAGALFLRQGGDGAEGAAVGFLATAVLIVPIAAVITRWRGRRLLRARLRAHPEDEDAGGPGARSGERSTSDPGGLRAQAHLVFLGGLLAMQVFQALVLQVDLLVLGREATLRWMRVGVATGLAREGADRLAGLYAQAQAFGLVPYQILLTASYVLFPAVAAARARGDTAGMRAMLADGGAATVLVAGFLASSVGGAPAAILRFFLGSGGAGGNAYPPSDGATILRDLAIAHAAGAVASVGATLLAAAGKTRAAIVSMGLLAVMAAAGATVGARGAGDPGVRLGEAVALGTMAGMVIASAVAIALAWRALGAWAPLATIFRAIAAAGEAMLVGDLLPVVRIRAFAIAPALLPPLVYLVALVILGEPVRARLAGIGRRSARRARAAPEPTG